MNYKEIWIDIRDEHELAESQIIAPNDATIVSHVTHDTPPPLTSNKRSARVHNYSIAFGVNVMTLTSNNKQSMSMSIPSLLSSFSSLSTYTRLTTAEEAAFKVLAKAREAVAYGSRGVGGLIMDNRTGRVIAEGRNRRYLPVKPPFQSFDNEVITWDYTAHGEIELIKWYFSNRYRYYLPDPADLTIVTSLDPCAMCTGSIIASGFKVATIALDKIGGMNINGNGAYTTLPLLLRRKAQDTSGLYAIDGQRTYLGPPNIPLCNTAVTGATGDACLNVFFNTPSSRVSPSEFTTVDDLIDPRSLSLKSAFRQKIMRAWPHAFSIRLSDPRRPTFALRRFLERLSHATPGSTNAVAFIDPFGNLLVASADYTHTHRGPVATAFITTVETYAHTRYLLFNGADTHNDSKRTLTEPRQGMFVWLYCPSPSLATTFQDLGAYGSTVRLSSLGTFQFFLPPRSGTIHDLRAQIAAMPPFYTQTVNIDPIQVGSAPTTLTRTALLNNDPNPETYPAYP